MADPSNIPDAEFDRIFHEIVGEMTPATIMSYPGVAEILREELNNDVLQQWEQSQEDNTDDQPDEPA